MELVAPKNMNLNLVARGVALEQGRRTVSTDTQATIATLESKMKAQKFDLPPRQGVARSAGSTGNTQ